MFNKLYTIILKFFYYKIISPSVYDKIMERRLDDKNINIELRDNLVLKCLKCDESMVGGDNLYKIDDWKNISNDEGFREIVLSWAGVVESKEEFTNA